MFRSGTTLLARMLDAHDEVAFASDPFAPLYKAIRNTVADTISYSVHQMAPLDDYYFAPEKQRLFSEIRKTPLDEIQAPADALTLQQSVAARAETFAPKIIPLLHKLRGTNFADLVRAAHEIIAEAYGTRSSRVVGSKEVWTGEFTPHLLAAFPDAKVVYLIRDPRAVCASKNAAKTHYPWLFLTRQWRKLAAIAWFIQQPSFPHRERVLVLRYEDLIHDPKHWAQELSLFIGIPFSDAMVDSTQFRDGSGMAWNQNSTHFEKGAGFNQRSIDRWRDVLSEREIQFIDFVCGPEMALFGYDEDPAGEILDIVLNPPLVASERLAEWIRPFVDPTIEAALKDSACEYLRKQVLFTGPDWCDTDKIRLCLYAELYDHLSNRQKRDG